MMQGSSSRDKYAAQNRAALKLARRGALHAHF